MLDIIYIWIKKVFREPGEGHACIFKIEREKHLNCYVKYITHEYMKENTTSYKKNNITRV